MEINTDLRIGNSTHTDIIIKCKIRKFEMDNGELQIVTDKGMVLLDSREFERLTKYLSSD